MAEDEKERPFWLVTLRPDGTVHSAPLEIGADEASGEFARLDDLEGLTLDAAGRVYAVTSHSRSGRGKEKKSREKLLRFRVEGNRLASPAAFTGLKAALVARHPALAEAAAVRGIDKAALESQFPRHGEFPFDSERKRMATVHAEGGDFLVCVKGAPEAVLERCPWRLTARGPAPFDAEAMLAQAERLAARGLRVLAFAERRVDVLPAGIADAESDLTFLGLVGLMDPPREEAADIGVAMGRGGTDVAREAAHMVLLDDNFASIVHAVREGRRIFDNIRKFIKYTMTSNSGEIWVIFLAPFLGLPIPLLPIHILWINLVTDGLPGLALAAERGERDIMRRPPRLPSESIFAHGMWQHILWVGLTMGAVCLVLQAWSIHHSGAHWQTMVFTVLCLSQLGHALAIRSERDSIFRIGFASNPLLLAAVLGTLALQLATIYVPALNPIFKTEPLDWDELALCLALSTVVFFAVEAEKWLVRRGWLYHFR